MPNLIIPMPKLLGRLRPGWRAAIVLAAGFIVGMLVSYVVVEIGHHRRMMDEGAARLIFHAELLKSSPNEAKRGPGFLLMNLADSDVLVLMDARPYLLPSSIRDARLFALQQYARVRVERKETQLIPEYIDQSEQTEYLERGRNIQRFLHRHL